MRHDIDPEETMYEEF